MGCMSFILDMFEGWQWVGDFMVQLLDDVIEHGDVKEQKHGNFVVHQTSAGGKVDLVTTLLI